MLSPCGAWTSFPNPLVPPTATWQFQVDLPRTTYILGGLMIRFVFLIWLGPLAAASAETLTRAYFVGKDQLWKWNVAENGLLNPSDEKDPFDGNTKPRIEVTPPQALEKPPFQSPLFRQGDTLYDFKTYKEQLKSIQGKFVHAIYNETTGRIIVSGDGPSHWLFQSRSIRMSEEGSFNLVELNFEIHEDDTLILATSATGLPGLTTLGKVGEGANTLSIEWEAQTYSEGHFVDLRLTLDGKIRNQTLKLKTGFNLLNDKRQTLTLGKTHKNQKLLTLSVTPHILLQGMVHISDLILDEQGKPLKRKEAINIHHEFFQKGLLDPETGKILRAFRVPPSFQTFLTTTSNEGDSDPFRAGEPQKPLQKDDYLTDSDPRIPAWPTDRLLDLKKEFRNNGIDLQASDFAILNLETDTLFVLTDPLNLELAAGVAMPAGSWGSASSVISKVQLIESQQKPTLESLGADDQTILTEISVQSLPGHSNSLNLGPVSLEIEAQIEANGKITETACLFQIKKGRKPSLILKTRIISENAQPQIIQSTQQNGRWHTLVLTSTIERLQDN